MTQLEIDLERPPLSSEAFRVRCYLVLLATAALVGLVAGVSQELLDPALFALALPACLLWSVSDLRVRRITGWLFWIQLLVTILPVCGLLLYFLWSRGLRGLVHWFAFWIPLSLVGLATAGLSYGITQFAQGKPW